MTHIYKVGNEQIEIGNELFDCIHQMNIELKKNNRKFYRYNQIYDMDTLISPKYEIKILESIEKQDIIKLIQNLLKSFSKEKQDIIMMWINAVTYYEIAKTSGYSVSSVYRFKEEFKVALRKEINKNIFGYGKNNS